MTPSKSQNSTPLSVKEVRLINAYMNILILNCGSSSVKFQVINTDLDRIEQDEDEWLFRFRYSNK